MISEKKGALSAPKKYQPVLSKVVDDPKTGVSLQLDVANSILHLTKNDKTQKVGHFPSFCHQKIAPLSKTGFGIKLGHQLTLNKLDSWKKRWLTLSENKLQYSEKENMKAKGTIYLSDVLEVLCVSASDKRKKNT